MTLRALLLALVLARAPQPGAVYTFRAYGDGARARVTLLVGTDGPDEVADVDLPWTSPPVRLGPRERVRFGVAHLDPTATGVLRCQAVRGDGVVTLDAAWSCDVRGAR